MTLQASPIDTDALLAAAHTLVLQLAALGKVEARVIGPQERSTQLDGGVALSVRTGGAGPGLVGLVAGPDAAATVAGEGDALQRWEPLMAGIVIALSARAGDLQPQNVELLAPGTGSGPALDPQAISVGLFLESKLLAAIGFVSEPAGEPAPAAQIFQPLSAGDPEAIQRRRMALLNDVEMGVSVELGRTRMTVRELLALAPSMIVELNKPAGAPVDLLVNGTLMARGEVVVVDEEFAIRISEIVTPEITERRATSERRGA
jgi:flagellar motor switch protein FliN